MNTEVARFYPSGTAPFCVTMAPLWKAHVHLSLRTANPPRPCPAPAWWSWPACSKTGRPMPKRRTRPSWPASRAALSPACQPLTGSWAAACTPALTSFTARPASGRPPSACKWPRPAAARPSSSPARCRPLNSSGAWRPVRLAPSWGGWRAANSRRRKAWPWPSVAPRLPRCWPSPMPQRRSRRRPDTGSSPGRARRLTPPAARGGLYPLVGRSSARRSYRIRRPERRPGGLARPGARTLLPRAGRGRAQPGKYGTGAAWVPAPAPGRSNTGRKRSLTWAGPKTPSPTPRGRCPSLPSWRRTGMAPWAAWWSCAGMAPCNASRRFRPVAPDRPTLTLQELEAFDPTAPDRGRERRFCCPLCGTGKRIDAAHRSLSLNTDTGAWHCHRCQAGGVLREKWQPLPPGERRRAAAKRAFALPRYAKSPTQRRR